MLTHHHSRSNLTVKRKSHIINYLLTSLSWSVRRKYQTSVLAVRTLPSVRSVPTRRRSDIFSVQSSRSVNKKLICHFPFRCHHSNADCMISCLKIHFMLSTFDFHWGNRTLTVWNLKLFGRKFPGALPEVADILRHRVSHINLTGFKNGHPPLQ